MSYLDELDFDTCISQLLSVSTSRSASSDISRLLRPTLQEMRSAQKINLKHRQEKMRMKLREDCEATEKELAERHQAVWRKWGCSERYCLD